MAREVFEEMAETFGKLAGTLAREFDGMGKQMVEGFRKGWQAGWERSEPATAGPAVPEKRD